jgi:hypothetical protein
MLRRGFLAVLMTVALVGCDDDDNPLDPADPNVVTFTAQLSAANEVPPITNAESTARGDVRIVFNLTRDAGNTITGATANFTVNLNSFPAGSTWTLAHIHVGNAGVGGGVVVNTGLTPGTAVSLTSGGVQNQQFNNIAITDATLVNNIVNNPAGYYFNVHTALNGTGAVRGQLVRQ